MQSVVLALTEDRKGSGPPPVGQGFATAGQLAFADAFKSSHIVGTNRSQTASGDESETSEEEGCWHSSCRDLALCNDTDWAWLRLLLYVID